MTYEELYDRASRLSIADRWRLVHSVLASIERETLSSVSSKIAPESTDLDFNNDDFVGMWKERQDLADSSAWLRELRESDRDQK